MTDIVVVTGPRGTGKTTLTTYLAYKAHRRSRRIVSNYSLGFPFDPIPRIPKPEKNETDEDFEERLGQVFGNMDNCLLLLDEAPRFLHARMSMDRVNLAWSFFIMETRKRGTDMILTSQLDRQVDVLARENADMLIKCRLSKTNRDVTIAECFLPWENRQGWRRVGHIGVHRPAVYSLFNSREIVSRYRTPTPFLPPLEPTVVGAEPAKAVDTLTDG